jgi:hypothetical protein
MEVEAALIKKVMTYKKKRTNLKPAGSAKNGAEWGKNNEGF